LFEETGSHVFEAGFFIGLFYRFVIQGGKAFISIIYYEVMYG